jgi:hypothetical protein
MAIAMIVVLAAFYAQSYAGRVQLANAQRAGCERQKQRDYNAAIAWSVAAATRRLEGDTGTAAAYDEAATTFWRYAVTNCARAYPAASPFGF